jgi:hypothetical protein
MKERKRRKRIEKKTESNRRKSNGETGVKENISNNRHENGEKRRNQRKTGVSGRRKNRRKWRNREKRCLFAGSAGGNNNARIMPLPYRGGLRAGDALQRVLRARAATVVACRVIAGNAWRITALSIAATALPAASARRRRINASEQYLAATGGTVAAAAASWRAWPPLRIATAAAGGAFAKTPLSRVLGVRRSCTRAAR